MDNKNNCFNLSFNEELNLFILGDENDETQTEVQYEEENAAESVGAPLEIINEDYCLEIEELIIHDDDDDDDGETSNKFENDKQSEMSDEHCYTDPSENSEDWKMLDQFIIEEEVVIDEPSNKRARGCTKGSNDKNLSRSRRTFGTDEDDFYNHVNSAAHDVSSNNDWTCKTCDATFPGGKVALSIHRRSHHRIECRKFTCEICRKRFSHEITLERHKASHKKVRKQYECNLCGKSLSRRSTLRIHLRAHALKSSRNNRQICYSCTGCGFVSPVSIDCPAHTCIVSNSTSVEYKRIVLSKVLMCEFCCCNFENRRSLCRHVERVHSGADARYICNECDVRFIRFFQLSKHRLLSHGVESGFLSADDMLQRTKFTIPQLFGCQLCDRVYHDYGAFNAHQKYAKHCKKTKRNNIVKRSKTKLDAGKRNKKNHDDDDRNESFDDDDKEESFDDDNKEESFDDDDKEESFDDDDKEESFDDDDKEESFDDDDKEESFDDDDKEESFDDDDKEESFDDDDIIFRVYVDDDAADVDTDYRKNRIVNYVCSYCGKRYQREFAYNKHLSLCHPEVQLELAEQLCSKKNDHIATSNGCSSYDDANNYVEMVEFEYEYESLQ